MTRAEAKAKLVSFGIAEPTEQQITDLLNSIQTETKSVQDKVDKYKTDAEKAAEYKKELDEIKEKDLSEAEKANKALEAAQKQIADLTANSLKSEAKAILGKAGFADEDMEALLPGLVADTLENTKVRANAFVTTMAKQTESAIKAHDKKLLDGTGTPDGGAGGGDDKKTDAQKFAETFVKENSSDSKGTSSIIDNYK